MYQTLKPCLLLKHLISACLIFFVLPYDAAAEKSAPIVVTIKPLYSLVAQLSKGVEEPVLLMKQIQSPHHYTMRPSEHRLLSNARMIVWIGPQMESHLHKIITQQKAVVVSAMQSNGLKLLNRRTKNSPQHTTDHSSPGHLEPGNLDPHIWLSSDNAIAISKHIAQQLIISDPENSSQYNSNLLLLIDKITRLSAEIKTSLKNNKQPFISYHDAFQYFEKEYGLNYFESITYDEEAGASLKHLRHIRKGIEKNNIQCLVHQPPKPDIIITLTRNTAIKTAALDPLGLTVNDEKEAWFEIMRGIALNFKRCLNT